MRDIYDVIASAEARDGSRLLIHRQGDTHIFMTAGDVEPKWYRLRFDIPREGEFNQNLKGVRLPYIVLEKDIYSLSEFKEWNN